MSDSNAIGVWNCGSVHVKRGGMMANAEFGDATLH